MWADVRQGYCLMTNNKRSKAVNRVIKLLNLATSDVNHEADLALNHAHSVIYSHNIQREEINTEKLCDDRVLDEVDWYGDWTDRPEPQDDWELDRLFAEQYQPYVIREKNASPDQPQVGASSVEAEPADSDAPIDDGANDSATTSTFVSADEGDALSDDSLIDTPQTAPSEDDTQAASPPSFEEMVRSGAFMVFERDGSESKALEPVASDQDDAETTGPELPSVIELPAEDEALLELSEEEARQRLSDVIEQLKDAKELYTECRTEREQGDIDQEAEKELRIQAEIEAEEAAERAFRKRAEEQQRWELEMRAQRLERRLREQEALKQVKVLREQQDSLKKWLVEHERKKAEQARLALLEEISGLLHIAAEHIADSDDPSFEQALQLMDDNQLTLTDLPLQQIHHKSIFMRLLEREAAALDDAKERERFTQELLGKYLSAYRPPTVDLEAKVLELLKEASAGTDGSDQAYESAKELLERNSLSIRDLDIGQIDQISLFVRLINWEAEKLPDMDSREHFTAKMLDRYFEATAKS